MYAPSRADQGFGHLHGFSIRERGVEIIERIHTCADGIPRKLVGVTTEHTNSSGEVTNFAAPTAANIEVLPIDVLVSVDTTIADIRIVPSDDVSTPIAH